LDGALREWRRSEAQRRGVPAFRIFSDKTLAAIAKQRPLTAQELLAISGIGIATVEKYGKDIYRLVNDNSR
jgi:superfamily II DNA helicase RecQ